MRNLFNQYDLDGNGEIDQDELYAIVDDMLHNKASSIYIVQVKYFDNIIFFKKQSLNGSFVYSCKPKLCHAKYSSIVTQQKVFK